MLCENQRIPGKARENAESRGAAFVADGCQWHGCEDRSRLPKANAEWWAQKLAWTRERDERNTGTDRCISETTRALAAGYLCLPLAFAAVMVTVFVRIALPATLTVTDT